MREVTLADSEDQAILGKLAGIIFILLDLALLQLQLPELLNNVDLLDDHMTSILMRLTDEFGRAISSNASYFFWSTAVGPWVATCAILPTTRAGLKTNCF